MGSLLLMIVLQGGGAGGTTAPPPLVVPALAAPAAQEAAKPVAPLAALKAELDAHVAAAQKEGRWLTAAEVADFTRRALAIAVAQDAKPPADGARPDALDARLFAADLAGSVDDPAAIALWDEATAPLATRHADDPRMAPLLLYVQVPPWLKAKGEALVVAIDAATRSPAVKAASRWRMIARARDREWDGTLDEPGLAKLERALDAFTQEHGAQESPLGGAWADHAESARFALRHLRVGCEAPPIAGRDREGREMTLAEQRGKVVLLEFWAYWCEEWVAALPQAREQVAKRAAQPFVRVGVNCDPPSATLDSLFAARPVPWRSFMDGEPARGPIVRQWEVRAFPTLYLLDAGGVIRRKWRGLPEQAELDAAIDALLADAKR